MGKSQNARRDVKEWSKHQHLIVFMIKTCNAEHMHIKPLKKTACHPFGSIWENNTFQWDTMED